MAAYRGISVKPTIGVGDKVQYSSVPENYFRATGKKLADVSNSWIFDHNPFVVRNEPPENLVDVTEMWNHIPSRIPRPRRADQPQVFFSNAERHAAFFGVPVWLNRPRLYRFEDFPFANRSKILFQTTGISHGPLPAHVVEHVVKKYRDADLYQIGLPSEPDIGIPRIYTPTLWDLAREVSEARMVIGPDSGPLWIAACYPDVVVKKVKIKPAPEYFQTWVPLEIQNIHAHWDDHCMLAFNPTNDDIGFTSSYRKL